MRWCWVDYKGVGEEVRSEGWWPVLKPWRVGMWMEGAEVTVGAAEVLQRLAQERLD